MKRKIYLAYYSLLATFLLIGGCKPEPVEVTPPPPIPITAPDCSQSFTLAIADTNINIIFNGPVGPQDKYYQGYRITDICFNPNDPNKMVASIKVTDPNTLQSSYTGSILLIYDLCSGEEYTIEVFEDLDIRTVDWGVNDVLVFGTSSGSHSIYTINPDGTDLNTINFSISGDVRNVSWHKDLNSILVSGFFTPTYHIDFNGLEIQDMENFNGVGFDFLPNGDLGFFGSGKIGTYNLATSVVNVLDDVSIVSNQMDISYSAVSEAFLWNTDTLLAATNVETGLRTDLAHGFGNTRFCRSASASKNGYLAYVAEITSVSLSSDGWQFIRTEIRFINPDGTDERRLVLDFE